VSRGKLAGIIIACTIAIIITIAVVIPPLVRTPISESTPASTTPGLTEEPSQTEQGAQFDVDKNALGVLNAFLKCAVTGDMDGMWNLICPDSRAQYRDAYDFKWYNGVYSKDWGYSLLVAYEVKSAERLSTWNTYSDAIEVQVTLKYAKSSVISALEDISGVHLLLDTDDETWITQLIRIDDSWNIVCPSTNPFKSFWYKPSS